MAERMSPYVVPLGVAAALPDADHANSYLAVVGSDGYWLVDCADGPIGRLQRASIDPLTVRGVIITHFHPDHVYGLPAYLLGLFLLAVTTNYAWKRALPIYARPEVLSSIREMLAIFAAQGWVEELPIVYCEITPEVGAPVAEDADFIITAAPSCHSVPSLAVRFACRETDRAFVYSSDTLPCDRVEALARNAALLFHEATDSDKGHTRPAAAGALAARAGVEQLVLIHYYTQLEAMTYARIEAETAFGAPVTLAEAMKVYPWS
jgi:ribonuclease Z